MDLYFYSPTCGPCRNVTPKIDAAITGGANIRKVDVSTDTGRFIAKLFGVTSTPAYVRFLTFDTLVGSEVIKEFEVV